jgi:hypothetical protein
VYHSVIGKRLVDCVNRRDNSRFTVREFFDNIYVPLFFGSPRLMQNVNNSPFDQAITKQKKPFTAELQTECLAAIHKKVKDHVPDASFFLGGPAAGTTETTSGQVTSMRIPVTKDDVYASWIGAACGLTVEGGFTLLIDSGDVLLTTFDGWYEYRRLLDQTPNLKPLQINAWNGQWLTSKMGRPTPFQAHVDKEGRALETQPWVQLLFALSYYFRELRDQRLPAYVYSLGQMNQTIGFVRLNLPAVRRPVDLYDQLFTVPEGLPAHAFEDLYETDASFRAACQAVEIGLRAIKPKDIFHADNDVPKLPSPTDGEKQLAYQIYQTWIVAMLNNKDLLSRAEELAEALHSFRQKDERGKTTRKQMVQELLTKRNRRDFIEALTPLLEEDGTVLQVFQRSVHDLLSLPVDNVPLFLTLVRFKYAAVAAKA